MARHETKIAHHNLSRRATAAQSPADVLISRLEGVRQTGPGRWVACCPAHDDRNPSLSIRELEDKRLLLHDFGGCSIDSIVTSVGLELSDLFPSRPEAGSASKPERRPFPASDVLACIWRETLIVSAAAGALLAGEKLNAEDYERLALAADRIQSAAALGGAYE